jgi:hypothetical protein
MGAVPNLFEIEIASELATGEATAKSIALALGSSETLLRAVQLGIDEAKQYNDRDIIAGLIRSRIAKAFSAPTANQMF